MDRDLLALGEAQDGVGRGAVEADAAALELAGVDGDAVDREGLLARGCRQGQGRGDEGDQARPQAMDAVHLSCSPG